MIAIIRWGWLGLVIVAGVGLISYLGYKTCQKNRALGIVVGALIIVLIAYNIYDNNRIIVKQQVVCVENLPAAWDGFRILQISDLHGKRFGSGQGNLIAQVNAINYDLIAFTGDMESASGSFEPFIELLDGITSKENMFYINGNDDLAYSTLTGIETDTGRMLEAQGCILLNQPYRYERAGKKLWLSNDLTRAFYDYVDVYEGIPREYFADDDTYRAYLEYFSELNALSAQIKDNADAKIALTHIPFTPNDLDKKTTLANFLDYDLILAGHYHGGQIIIPFYGAVYIPAGATPRENLFPDQKLVSGLVEYNGIQQYISRGLGASRIPFRLFNTPEINLIILHSR